MSPRTRNIVSRHWGWSLVALNHQSATPAPPTKPIRPSTTSSSRWVRLLNRLALDQVTGWYQQTRPPASRSGLR